jgi:hypothetical protein
MCDTDCTCKTVRPEFKKFCPQCGLTMLNIDKSYTRYDEDTGQPETLGSVRTVCPDYKDNHRVTDYPYSGVIEKYNVKFDKYPTDYSPLILLVIFVLVMGACAILSQLGIF